MKRNIFDSTFFLKNQIFLCEIKENCFYFFHSREALFFILLEKHIGRTFLWEIATIFLWRKFFNQYFPSYREQSNGFLGQIKSPGGNAPLGLLWIFIIIIYEHAKSWRFAEKKWTNEVCGVMAFFWPCLRDYY